MDDQSFISKIESNNNLSYLINFDLVENKNVRSLIYKIGFDLSFIRKVVGEKEIEWPSLSLVHQNCLFGSFSYENSKYEIEVIPISLTEIHPYSMLVNISEPNKNIRAFDSGKAATYKIYDTIPVGKTSFRVDSINMASKKIYISVFGTKQQ